MIARHFVWGGGEGGGGAYPKSRFPDSHFFPKGRISAPPSARYRTALSCSAREMGSAKYPRTLWYSFRSSTAPGTRRQYRAAHSTHGVSTLRAQSTYCVSTGQRVAAGTRAETLPGTRSCTAMHTRGGSPENFCGVSHTFKLLSKLFQSEFKQDDMPQPSYTLRPTFLIYIYIADVI